MIEPLVHATKKKPRNLDLIVGSQDDDHQFDLDLFKTAITNDTTGTITIEPQVTLTPETIKSYRLEPNLPTTQSRGPYRTVNTPLITISQTKAEVKVDDPRARSNLLPTQLLYV